MARRPLICHPDTPTDAVKSILANVERVLADRIAITFHLKGDMQRIMQPVLNPNRRKDGLWHHTCFEAFLKAGGAKGYTEYNFATSGEWAAYCFSEYRSGRTDAELKKPDMVVRISRFRMFLVAYLTADLPPLSLALSAVIEEIDGTKSYWALAHPPGKPDFHHRDCFALELAPPGTS